MAGSAASQPVARKLGIPHKEFKSWKTVEDLRPELEPFVAELGRMPWNTELIAAKRSDLSNAVHKFGGQAEIARTLGYPRRAKATWADVEDLSPHLALFVTEVGRMPNDAELITAKRSDLTNAVHKFGGDAKVPQALGYATPAPRSGRASTIFVRTLTGW